MKSNTLHKILYSLLILSALFAYTSCSEGEGDDVFTVIFDTGGGTPATFSKEVKKGLVLQKPQPPTKTGYVFIDWFLNSEDTAPFDFSKPVTKSLTLYARYSTACTVTLYHNNGTGKSSTLQAAEGQPVMFTDFPMKGGYIFSHWYTDEACTQVYERTQPVTGDLTLWAGYVKAANLQNVHRIARVTGKTTNVLEDASQLNPSRTAELYNVGGTDLGISWITTSGRVGLFFGDTYGADHQLQPGGGPGGSDWRSNVLGFSTDTNLEDGLLISSMAMDPNNNMRAREIVPMPNYKAFTSIPTGAISANGKEYVHYMNVQIANMEDEPNRRFSGLYVSDDDGETWTNCTTVRFPYRSKFGLVAYETKDGYVYMMGSEIMRIGHAYLARCRETDMEDMSKYEYWNGAKWVAGDEKAAVKVIEQHVGEASLMYHESLQRWIYTYNYNDGGANGGIRFAQAVEITGPWKETDITFENIGWGIYSPYLYKPINTGDVFYFTLSTWQHYNVFLMKGTLSLD